MATKTKKGGAPKGNTNARKGFASTHALQKALDIKSRGLKNIVVADNFKVLVQMWLRTIDLALEGDIRAMKLIDERLDGKPGQYMELDAKVEVNTHEDWLKELSNKSK